MKPYKYPGELGKPDDGRWMLANALLYYGDPDKALREKKDRYDSRTRRLFELLFAHYNIPTDDVAKWFALAFCLANNHVPAFTYKKRNKVGRPRKDKKTIARLERMYAGRQQRGRKPDPTRAQFLEKLLRAVIRTSEKKGYQGRGTIRRALAVIVEEFARRNNESVPRALRIDVPNLARLVSEAKKLYPELAAKLPR